MTRIILPKLEQEEIRIFTLEEQKAFIEALPDNTSGRALYFILGTGLRLAELTGLRWSDIHENEFHISQTIRRNRNFDENDPRRTSLQTSSPKTKAGRRTIPLPPKLKEVFAVQRQQQLISRLTAGSKWHDLDLVFTTEVGTPYEGRTVVNLWLALPFMIMIMDGGLKSIDRSYYESATLDGAGPIRQAISITVLKPVRNMLERC